MDVITTDDNNHYSSIDFICFLLPQILSLRRHHIGSVYTGYKCNNRCNVDMIIKYIYNRMDIECVEIFCDSLIIYI